MKTHIINTLTFGASLALASSAQATLVVYEGFDYTNRTAIVSKGTGTGFDGNWTGITAAGVGAANVVAATGLSFGDLDVADQALNRSVRDGRGTISRTISSGSQGALTADNTTIWFSVILDPTINTATATGGQAGNSYATLTFGNANLTDVSSGAQNGEGTTIAGSGNAVGVGFFGGPRGTTFPDVGIQGVTFSGGTISQGNGAPATSIITGDTVSLIVGRIDWAASGQNDTISLFDVTDTSNFDLTTAVAFSTMTLDVNQADFDTISIADGQTAAFDEIRFGGEIEDVLPGFNIISVPEPSSAILISLAGLGLLRRRRS